MAERRQCQSSALCCALPLPGVRQWRRYVGLCRVSFSVFSWVFVFVKAYFYVSTSGMVSQCVLRLSCKTPAVLTLWLFYAARFCYGDLRLWLGDEYRATPLLLMVAQPTHRLFAVAIHRTNAKHKRNRYHANYRKTLPRHPLSRPREHWRLAHLLHLCTFGSCAQAFLLYILQ